MQAIFVMTLLAVTAAGFAPSVSIVCRPKNISTSSICARPSSFQMSATSMKMGKMKSFGKKKSSVSIPNPFKALPWNAKKEREREARRMKIESATLHRELGIADDATFEDIQTITLSLIAKAEAEGDIKKKLKIEIAKDKIMQIRLSERLAGLATLTDEARQQSRLEEADENDEDDLFPEEKKREWRLPRWAEGLIVKPDAAYRNTQIKVFGILSAIAFILPPMSEKIILINWMFAAGQLSTRGMPDQGGEGYNPYGGRRGKPHQRTALLLSLGFWMLLKTWTAMLGNIKYIFGPRYVIVMEAIIMNICLGVFTAYTQTYKG